MFFSFFARKVNFGAKLSREETQERATDVGPVKKKEKKREREREREREGRRDQKRVSSTYNNKHHHHQRVHTCKDLLLVRADGLGEG